jgi:hypothetical protein
MASTHRNSRTHRTASSRRLPGRITTSRPSESVFENETLNILSQMSKKNLSMLSDIVATVPDDDPDPDAVNRAIHSWCLGRVLEAVYGDAPQAA